MNDTRVDHRPRSRFLQGAIVLATLAVIAAIAPVALAQEADCEPSVAQAELGEYTPGVWVYRDPKTGRLTEQPSEEAAAAMKMQIAELVNESTEGLVPVRHPNGALSLDLKGRFMSMSVVTIGPNGKPETSCVNSLMQAIEILMPRKPVPTLDGLETE